MRTATLLVAVALAASVHAKHGLADGCKPIHFAAGERSTTVKGSAPAEGVVCYSIGTGADQTATLKVTSGDNTVFTIDGLVDAQDSYTFKTERKTYKVLVGQLMRSASAEKFSLDVVVK